MTTEERRAQALMGRRVHYIDGDGFIRRGDVVGLARDEGDRLTLLRLADPDDAEPAWVESVALVIRNRLMDVGAGRPLEV